MSVLWIFLGALLGLAFMALARLAAAPERIVAIGLVVAALIYVGFALAAEVDYPWLRLELAGVMVYGVLAVAGWRHSIRWLALGWALHVLWDVLLHQSGPASAYTPDFYPSLCVGFDSVVAAGCLVIRPSRPVTISRS